MYWRPRYALAEYGSRRLADRRKPWGPRRVCSRWRLACKRPGASPTCALMPRPRRSTSRSAFSRVRSNCCTMHISTLSAETGLSLRFAQRSALRTNRTCAGAANAHAAFVRSCGNVHAAMQPTSWKRPFKATISVDFKPTFRRVMLELTHRGQSRLWILLYE
jgi:hypothetical protein